jgi:hypothetical protein
MGGGTPRASLGLTPAGEGGAAGGGDRGVSCCESAGVRVEGGRLGVGMCPR